MLLFFSEGQMQLSDAIYLKLDMLHSVVGSSGADTLCINIET